MTLFGQFRERLDARGRVAVPREFLDAIGAAAVRQGLVLTRGFDRCLCLFPMESWRALLARFRPILFGGFSARMLERLLLGDAEDVAADRRGRIRVPERLRHRAGLGGEALLIGASNRIELWNPDRWAALKGPAEGRLEELAEATAAQLRQRRRDHR